MIAYGLPATLGTSQSVLISGVASFQGWICTRKHTSGWGSLSSGVQIRGEFTVLSAACHQASFWLNLDL